MKASTVARVARYVHAEFPNARDVAVSNLIMVGPGGRDDEQDAVVFLVMIGQRTHTHVIGFDDGTIAIGENRVETQQALAQQSRFGGSSFVSAVVADRVIRGTGR